MKFDEEAKWENDVMEQKITKYARSKGTEKNKESIKTLKANLQKR